MRQGHYHNVQLENLTKDISTLLDSATILDYMLYSRLLCIANICREDQKNMYDIRKNIQADASRANLYETERPG